MQGMQPAPNEEDLWEVKQQSPLDGFYACMVNITNESVKMFSEHRCRSDKTKKEVDERRFSIVRQVSLPQKATEVAAAMLSCADTIDICMTGAAASRLAQYVCMSCSSYPSYSSPSSVPLKGRSLFSSHSCIISCGGDNHHGRCPGCLLCSEAHCCWIKKHPHC